MKVFLRFLPLIFVFCYMPIGGAWATFNMDCSTAANVFEKCHYNSDLQRDRNCETCCNMNYGGEGTTFINECTTMCTNNSTDGCDDSGSGSGSGGGSGSGCTYGSCSSHSDCDSGHPICGNGGCCREATSSETITIKTPVCNGTNACTCELFNGGAGDNYETWLLLNCGVVSGSGDGQNSALGFPQTKCKSDQKRVLGESARAVLEYGNGDSYWSACQGYIQQSSGTLDSMTTCLECQSGYTLLPYSTVRGMTYGDDYISEDYSSWPCSSPNDTFSDASSISVCVMLCEPTYGANWESAGTGYERRTKTYPSGCSQTSGYEYRCAAGYYGTPNSNGTSGCTLCPLVCDSDIRSTSAAGTTNVSNCCAAVGTTGNDSIGRFTLKTQACAG